MASGRAAKAAAEPNDRKLTRAGVAESSVPEDFKCPITTFIMTDPVCAEDGHTYERRAIERWLEDHDTSPLTGAKLPSKMLLTNYALRNAIEESSEILKK